jgi:Flp pilus assembly protein TadG
MNARRRPHSNDDRGVVAIELVIAMPFIIAMIVCVISLAGLYSTKSRVVGAARDGARALAIKPGSSNADTNPNDGITVTLDPSSSACPLVTDPNNPQQVTAKATTNYTVSIPFVHTWSGIAVTERATMPCG